MTKRRRERDRPKAANDAPYNPNKRVLLSYASADEVSDLEDELRAVPRESTATIEPHEGVQAERSVPNENHTLLREDEESEEVAEDEVEEEEYEEDTTANEDSLFRRGVRKNQTTGQWAALGSLSYQWEEGNEDEAGYDSTEDEAMAYLRTVRSERQGLPTVFKAANTYTKRELYESGIGDTRGYYEDGAYVSRASLGPQLPASEKVFVEPQEAFTEALKARFLRQREQMHLSPSVEALTALDSHAHPISFPAKNNGACVEWNRLVRTTAPSLAQVQSMLQDDVFRLLELVQKHYLVRETDIGGKVSAWIWSLLARLDDVGTMDNDQVWQIRELGKKAILVQLSFTNSAGAEQLEEAGAEERNDAASDASNIELELAEVIDAPSPTTEQPSTTTIADDIEEVQVKGEPTQNTLATLDIILVVVGHVFRQRDLLEFRQTWSESRSGVDGV